MKQDRGAITLSAASFGKGVNSGGPVVKENAGQNKTLDAEEFWSFYITETKGYWQVNWKWACLKNNKNQ